MYILLVYTFLYLFPFPSYLLALSKAMSLPAVRQRTPSVKVHLLQMTNITTKSIMISSLSCAPLVPKYLVHLQRPSGVQHGRTPRHAAGEACRFVNITLVHGATALGLEDSLATRNITGEAFRSVYDNPVRFETTVSP